MIFPCSFQVCTRPFTEHHLRHVQGRKQLWFGWNQVRACAVCVLWRWHHTFHDVDVATVKRQRRGEGASSHTASLQLCSAVDWSYLSRRDLWGKISEGKKPWCSQYCLFISHMECNSVSTCSSDSLEWVTGFIFRIIFIFSVIIGCTDTLNAKSHISFCHCHIGLKMQYVR